MENCQISSDKLSHPVNIYLPPLSKAFQGVFQELEYLNITRYPYSLEIRGRFKY
jgi:hypothetical protein